MTQERLQPEFRLHRECAALTFLTIDRMPRDGSLGRTLRYRTGDMIWRLDDPANSIYFLLRGSVEVFTTDSEGRETLLRTIAPKHVFGEFCFCAPRRGQRRNFARALSETRALEINLDEFFDFLQKDLPALVSLVYTFCTRLSETEARVEVLGQRDAGQRLARLLLQLAMFASPSEPIHAAFDRASLQSDRSADLKTA